MGSSKNGQHKLHGQSASSTIRVQVYDALQVPTGSEMSENPAAVPVCAIYTCLTSQLGMRICCISQNKEGLAHCLPLMIL